MQNSQLDRLLRLMRRTGDKAMVVDRDSDHIFMLMDLDEYENMLDTLDGTNGPVPGDDDFSISKNAATIDSEEPVVTSVVEPVIDLPVIQVEPIVDVPATIIEETREADETDEIVDVADKTDEEDSLEDYVLDDLLDVENTKSPQPEDDSLALVGAAPTESITMEPILEPGAQTVPEAQENQANTENSANTSEESLGDVPNDGEEEKFYLEPVE